MARKIKNVIIYIAVCIVVLASFKVPEILLNYQNNNIELAVYKKEGKNNLIDVDAEKIYLVKAIHEIEDDDSIVAINSNIENKILVEPSNEHIQNELLKLKEYNIIQDLKLNEDTKISIGIANKMYQNRSNQYTIYSMIVQIEDKTYRLEIEMKTGKILYITLEKENLNHIATTEELLKNFINYLDLHIIDDWKFENGVMKSVKAQLLVALVESDSKYILSIHSSNNKAGFVDVTRKN